MSSTQGEKARLSNIAAAAGVGVGTLYRHFPDRARLLAALTRRSFHLVLDNALSAAATPGPAIDALARFFDLTIKHREELILPLHGGPADLDDESEALRGQVRAVLADVISRGQRDGSLRPDLTPLDVIIAGAMLAQPLPHVADRSHVARRQAQNCLAGPADPSTTRHHGPATPR